MKPRLGFRQPVRRLLDARTDRLSHVPFSFVSPRSEPSAAGRLSPLVACFGRVHWRPATPTEPDRCNHLETARKLRYVITSHDCVVKQRLLLQPMPPRSSDDATVLVGTLHQPYFLATLRCGPGVTMIETVRFSKSAIPSAGRGFESHRNVTTPGGNG